MVFFINMEAAWCSGKILDFDNKLDLDSNPNLIIIYICNTKADCLNS